MQDDLPEKLGKENWFVLAYDETDPIKKIQYYSIYINKFKGFECYKYALLERAKLYIKFGMFDKAISDTQLV